MSVQPHLPFGNPTAAPAATVVPASGVEAAGKPSEAAAPVPAPVWLQRLSLGVLVIFCLYLGLLIAVLPWWKEMWDRNPLLLQHTVLRAFLMQGWVRGAVTGLGLLDLWIGISELIHYRDYRK